jgi:ubiquinone biosynthesis protein
LHSGERVVVKVQRPGIRELVERDLDILRTLTGMAETWTAWGANYGLSSKLSGLPR